MGCSRGAKALPGAPLQATGARRIPRTRVRFRDLVMRLLGRPIRLIAQCWESLPSARSTPLVRINSQPPANTMAVAVSSLAKSLATAERTVLYARANPLIPGATERRGPHLPALRPRTLCIAVAFVVSARRQVDLPNNSCRSHVRRIGSNLRPPRKTPFRRDDSATRRCEPATA